MLAGYKGYGLGTMVEILSAALQTGSFLYGLTGIGEGGEPAPFRVGHFFMAINIESFCALEEFRHTTGQILRELRASTRAPGLERIYTAGEKEYENSRVTALRGIPAVPNLQKEIKFLQKELGLWQYQFPF
jgi:LDH2 family malate/lactate/ureidoglycolate dehydrogenase